MGKYTIYRVSMIRNPKIYSNATTPYYNLFYMACPSDVVRPKEWMFLEAIKHAGFESIEDYIDAFPHRFDLKTVGGNLYVTPHTNDERSNNAKELLMDSMSYDVVENWYSWITMNFMRTEYSKTINLLSYIPITIDDAVGSMDTINSYNNKLGRNDLWFCDDWVEEK